MSHRALLALGSNLGDRWANLCDAVAGLPDVVAVSEVYETAPVGGPDQGPYLNCVVRLDTELDARALLEAAREREQAVARRRGLRWWHAPSPGIPTNPVRGRGAWRAVG